MRKTPFVLAALLTVAGICVMLWPVVTGHRLQSSAATAVQEFLADRDEPEQQYPELLAALQEYNRQLYAEKQCNLTDLEACEEPTADLTAYGIEDEIIGWRGADYFRHIDRLQIGDTVTLTNLWETLTYTVTDIQIIQPHEVDKIKIQQGHDLLTLLTCHPYASGGRQRFVVYCERTEVR